MGEQWRWASVVFGAALLWGCDGGPTTTSHVLDDDEEDAVSVAGMADRSRYCTSLSGTVEERVKGCLESLGSQQLSPDASTMVGELTEKGKLLVVGGNVTAPGELAALTPELQALLLGKDEKKVAEALRNGGVRAVLVHRDFMAALDRDSLVLARLANHDHLDWFQLRHVSEYYHVYSVRSSPSRVPLSTGKKLVAGLRARLAGKTPEKIDWKPDSVRLIGSVRGQGNTLAIRHVVGTDLEKVLDELADKIERRWEREVQTEGFGKLRDKVDDLRVEVQVVMERASVEPRSRFALFDLFEIGVDGMMFREGSGDGEELFAYMPGSEAVTRSHRTIDSFLQFAVDEFGWRERRPWERSGTRLDLIRTSHFMEDRLGGTGRTVRMYRGYPEVSMDAVTDRNVQQMLVDGGEWWSYNLRPDKSFEYKYWPHQNRRSEDYNEVRHILGTRDLADAYRYKNDPKFLESSWKSMEWLLQFQIQDTDAKDAVFPHPPQGSMLFRYPMKKKGTKEPNQKLGTVAVAILGWIAWAEASGSHDQDENIKKMARYVLSQQDSNGKFIAYNVPSSHSYAGTSNDIVPGEAALALGMTAEYFNDPSWIESFEKFVAFYEPWFDERKVKTNPYGRWPHDSYDNLTRLELVQFGPWSVMASKQAYKLTKNKKYAEFGLKVADWMIDYYQWSAERSPFPDYVGGYYKMPEELPAMQTFCYSEGTTAAMALALMYDPSRVGKYETATKESIRFLRLMQYDRVSSYFTSDPRKVFGGVRYAMNEPKIRTDYVGHGMSTLSQYLDARATDLRKPLDIRDPKAWAEGTLVEAPPTATVEVKED
jgi:hypothetical protein